MTPRLPRRLRALLALIPDESMCVADIGAGHGALSAWLAHDGRRVIATEARQGPYDELRHNLARWGVTDLVDVRRGIGLEPLAVGEADTAVVAGMGGHTILDIATPAPARGIRFLVLQCMQHRALVEPWIATRGFSLLRRLDVVERARVYPAWLVGVAPPA